MAIDRLALNIVNLVLSFINVFSHALGISLLSSLDASKKSPQQLMIINLSAAELINSLVRAVVVIIHMLPPPYMPVFIPPMPPKGLPGNSTSNMTRPLRPRPPMTDAQLSAHYFMTFSMTGFYFIVYLIMMVITLDRLLVVLLKSKYSRICSILNTKILLILIWAIGIAMIIGFPVGHHVHKYDHRFHFEYHIYLVTDVVFLVFAIISYIVVFLRYRDYEIHAGSSDEEKEGDLDNTGRKSSSILRMLSNPMFYVPLLIIITYFVFIILPHWIYIGKKYEEESKDMDHWAAMLIMLLLGYWSDAIVYIFLQAPVRKLLWRWLRCEKGIVADVHANGHATINTGF